MLTAHHVSAVGVGWMTCLSVHRPADPAGRLDAMEAEMSQGGSDGFQLKNKPASYWPSLMQCPVPVVAIRIANNEKDRRQELAHFALRVRQETSAHLVSATAIVASTGVILARVFTRSCRSQTRPPSNRDSRSRDWNTHCSLARC